jgi:hypothetical protein
MQLKRKRKKERKEGRKKRKKGLCKKILVGLFHPGGNLP